MRVIWGEMTKEPGGGVRGIEMSFLDGFAFVGRLVEEFLVLLGDMLEWFLPSMACVFSELCFFVPIGDECPYWCFRGILYLFPCLSAYCRNPAVFG